MAIEVPLGFSVCYVPDSVTIPFPLSGKLYSLSAWNMWICLIKLNLAFVFLRKLSLTPGIESTTLSTERMVLLFLDPKRYNLFN